VPNVWGEEWDTLGEQPWEGGGKSARLPRGEHLGASLYELPPGATGGLYHFHHGAEELLLVLRGRPTLRGPDGERQLEEGEAVHFVRGPDGAHQLRNDTDELVRYVMAGTFTSPESVEYPDSGEISTMARTNSQRGEPLWMIRSIED
jgi:uncharacterized cupin superfamily protein